jgi:hypothetical protein
MGSIPFVLKGRTDSRKAQVTFPTLRTSEHCKSTEHTPEYISCEDENCTDGDRAVSAARKEYLSLSKKNYIV